MIKFVAAIFVTSLFSIAQGASIGEKFHEDTKITRTQVQKDIVTPKPAMPPPFKEYQGKIKITLPKPEFKGMSLEDAIVKRRSIRDYVKKPLTLTQLSQLLFASQGVTGKIHNILLRSVPSAGALYPFEIYAVINNVESLKAGLYHYSIKDHSIVLIKEGNFKKELLHAALGQSMVEDAGVVFVLSAIFDRTKSKYGERGYRYVYMEAGYISQNIYLEATSLGLGSVVIGAFDDDDVNKLIGVDGKKEAVIALHVVGRL